MKNRNIKKQFWLNRDEATVLKKKAKKACLTEAALIRFLISGYAPKEKPDEKFYEEMNKITVLTDCIRKLAFESKDEITRDLLLKEIQHWHSFQSRIENHFLVPEEMRTAWR